MTCLARAAGRALDLSNELRSWKLKDPGTNEFYLLEYFYAQLSVKNVSSQREDTSKCLNSVF